MNIVIQNYREGGSRLLMQGDNERGMSHREYLKWEEWINYVTQKYEKINKDAKVNTYNAETEEELREKQNEELDATWIKILD